jgi:hypothetical protein
MTIHHVAVNHSLTLLKMGKWLPETCWADSKINKIVIVASSWSFIYFALNFEVEFWSKRGKTSWNFELNIVSCDTVQSSMGCYWLAGIFCVYLQGRRRRNYHSGEQNPNSHIRGNLSFHAVSTPWKNIMFHTLSTWNAPQIKIFLQVSVPK